jgi:hypothetical protein
MKLMGTLQCMVLLKANELISFTDHLFLASE